MRLMMRSILWTARYSAVVIVAIGTTAALSNNNSAHPDAKPQAETPFQVFSRSVRNCIKAMRRCHMDIILFAPRSAKYACHYHIKITRSRVVCRCARDSDGARPGYHSTVSSDSDYSSQRSAFLRGSSDVHNIRSIETNRQLRNALGVYDTVIIIDN